MAEYALGARRLTGKFPQQLVVYVGRAPMKMPRELHGARFSLEYHLVDIRQLEGAELIASPDGGQRDSYSGVASRSQEGGS